VRRWRRATIAVLALAVVGVAVWLWGPLRATSVLQSTPAPGSIEEAALPVAAIPPAPPVTSAPGASRGQPETGAPSGEEDSLAEIARLNATDKPRALALALSADDAYPSAGADAEARRAMIITLLVDLGRMEEARQRVYRYIEAYPDSPYLPLVEGKTGIHPRPMGPTQRR
jgi:hypothetical protein